MKGWKTKTGTVVGVIGGGLLAIADTIPVPEWIPWIKCAGTFLSFVGGGLAAYGIAHKVEKQGDK